MCGVYIPGQSLPVMGQAATFSSPQILQYIPGNDAYPAALQASDGTLWVAWQHYQYQTYYMTLNGGLWSPVQNLPMGTKYSISPSMAQFGNGTIIFLWSSNQTGSWNLYYDTLAGGVWSKTVQITSVPNNDFFPQAVVYQNSALWLFWQRSTSTGLKQIYYKVLTGNSWSSDIQFTLDSTLNVTPSVMVAKNGVIRVAWSKLVSGNYYIYSRVYSGTGWSADAPLTAVPTWDLEPGLVQDRDGTIWLYWSRQLQLSTGSNPIFEQKLFSKFSTDNGQTWSADTQQTFTGSATTPIDDLEPAIVQGATRNVDGSTDHGLWVFFSSDLSNFGADYDIYFLRSSQIYPIHDVAVSNPSAYPWKMFPWGIRAFNIGIATISVTVTDLGDFSENVSLTVQAVNTTNFNVGTKQVYLTSGAFKIVAFYWNATFSNPGVYTIIASIAPVPGETIGNSPDNTASAKALTILYPGDLDLNGRVNIFDASLFGAAWNTVLGSPNYNPDADINNTDHRVDIIDASIFGANWQKSL